MSDTRETLAADVCGLMGAMRDKADGRWACLVDPLQGILAEDPPSADVPELAALRAHVDERREAIMRVPAQMTADEPEDDPFEAWQGDDFFLCVINNRVALLVACADPEVLQQEDKILRALVDRLMRFDPNYRLDKDGRGLFLARPRLDMIVMARAE